MMEYFAHKKIKKHQEEKKRTQTKVETPAPVLSDEDEYFLERIVSAESTPPPLPNRPSYLNPEAGDSTENDSQMVVHDAAAETEKDTGRDMGKGKGREKLSEKEKKAAKKAASRFSFITSKFGKKKDGLSPTTGDVSAKEAEDEANDINKILDELNLSAINNRAFSISKESQVLVQKFTVILKDLVNGAPHAYDDLVNLIEDSQGTLAKSYDHLPSFLQKLITTLPNKLTSSLAPELLLVATEAQGLAFGGGSSNNGGGGVKGAMKNLLVPGNLKELVTKPGAVVGMLKYIMNVLKLRWPAFMGTNVLFSLGLFILLFVFWYCHKRGKQVRLEKEGLAAGGTVESNGRVTELDDDPMLQAPKTTTRSRSSNERRDQRDLSPPRERHSDRDRDDRPSSRRSRGSHRERSSGDKQRNDENKSDKNGKRR